MTPSSIKKHPKRKNNIFSSLRGEEKINETVDFVELLTNQLAKHWKDEQKVSVVKPNTRHPDTSWDKTTSIK